MAKSKHLKVFEKEHLRPDESIVTVDSGGYITEGSSDIYGDLIVTDERVVFYRKSLFGEQMIGMETREISSIDRRSSFGIHTISLRSQSVVLEFNSFKRKSVVDKFVAEIEEQRSSIARRGSVQGNVADELRKLSELSAEGILSGEEFERAKGMFIGKPVSRQDEAARLLRNLHELQCQGALTESEFNMKKWDILSKN